MGALKLRRGSVLVVEDDDALLSLITTGLEAHGFGATGAPNAEAAMALLVDRDPDVVLADLQLPGRSGAELCRTLREQRPELPVVVMTAFASIDAVVEVMRAGAHDFVAKPIDLELIASRLGRVVEERQNRRELQRLRTELEATRRFEELEGESPEMQKLFALLARVAATDATALLLGESGTGKEVAARALHRRSHRSRGPFVALNCSAFPEQLLESELFGHVRGAFTDARADRDGLFVQASGGTLLLDEIGDLPLGLQPKLLRALEERRVRPLGATRERPFDVRILGATHRDLDAEVAAGRFRQDLHFRLDVVRVTLPPLRVRGGDIVALAHRFLEGFAQRAGAPAAKLSPEAVRATLGYSWPGNVRELRNAMERAVALASTTVIGLEDLPDALRAARARPPTAPVATVDVVETDLSLEQVERRHIERVMASLGGNKRAAARVLGVDRRTLYRKLTQFGMAAGEDD